jgi:hypothetical protein
VKACESREGYIVLQTDSKTRKYYENNWKYIRTIKIYKILYLFETLVSMRAG